MSRISDAFAKIKKWHNLPAVIAAERYVQHGDPADLAKVSPGQWDYWTHDLIRAIGEPPDWSEEDRRALHVAVAMKSDPYIGEWLERLIKQEKPDADTHGRVREALEEAGCSETQIAGLTIASVGALIQGDQLTSAGRYLLSLSDEQLIKAMKHPAPRMSPDKLAACVLRFAPQRVDALIDAFLTRSQYGVSPAMLKTLLQAGDRYEAKVLAAFRAEKQVFSRFHQVRGIYEANPGKHRDLALQTCREAMEGSGGQVNHGPVAEWMIQTFDREVVPDLVGFFSGDGRGNHWDQPIIEAAKKHLRAESVPVMRAVLDQPWSNHISDAKTNPWAHRYHHGRRMKAIRTALAGLIEFSPRDHADRIRQELDKGIAEADPAEASAFVRMAGQWDLPGMAEKIWPLLEHKSKPLRETAAQTLAKLGEPAIPRAAALLTHKKADARAAAAVLLAAINTPAALKELEARLDAETNDQVRDEMLKGLADAWAKQGRSPTVADVKQRVARVADRLPASPAKWLKIETLPPLKWKDGQALEPVEVRFLLYRQSRVGEMRPDVEARMLYDLIDRKSSARFAEAVLRGFLGSEAEAGDRWALAIAGLLGDDSLVPPLVSQIHAWVNANRGKLAEYAVQALALLGTDAALLAVDAMAIRYRNKMKNVGRAAGEAFAAAAERSGITPEELGDRVVPWLGFEPGKPRIIEAGGQRFELRIGPDFKLAFQDLTKNKPVKSLPKSVGKELLDEVKETNAVLREVTKAQNLRLENLLVIQRRWPAARWKELFLRHPLLLPYAARIVWAHHDEGGRRVGVFRALEDRTLTTERDETYELPDTGAVGLVHPLDLDEAERSAWVSHLADYEIEPPFPQLERQVVRVGDEQRGLKAYVALSGKTLNAMTFKGRAEKLGWRRGSVCDGGSITSYVKSFHAAGTDVFLSLEDFFIGAGVDDSVTLGDAMFVRAGTVKVGSYEYDEPGNTDDPRVLPFGEVPEIVFSEALGDLQRIGGQSEREGEGA